MNQYLLYKNYELVILRLLEISSEDSDLVDYYWFQLLSIHLHLSKTLINRYISVYILSLYQQCLLSIALQYPVLGMRMVWYFLSELEDYKNKRLNQYQYIASLSLLLQFEIYSYGGAECLLSHHSFPSTPTTTSSSSSSSAATSQSCSSPFESLLYPSRIQKLELWKELQTLLQSRQLIQQKNRYQQLIRVISTQSELTSESSENHEGTKAMSLAGTAAAVGEHEDSHLDDNSITCLTIFKKGFSQILISKPSFPLSIQSIIHETSDCLFTITSADWYVVYNPFSAAAATATAAATSSSSFSSSSSSQYSSFHKDQYQFMTKLFNLIDSLRFIEDYRQREATFIYEIYQNFLTLNHEIKDIGYDPTTIASEPLYRLKEIYVDECKIYKTKARTPTRIVFGIEIDPIEFTREDVNILFSSHIHDETGSNSSNEVSFYHPNHHPHNIISGEERDSCVDSSTLEETREGKMISDINQQVASKLNQTLLEMCDQHEEKSKESSFDIQSYILNNSHKTTRRNGSQFLTSVSVSTTTSSSLESLSCPSQTPLVATTTTTTDTTIVTRDKESTSSSQEDSQFSSNIEQETNVTNNLSSETLSNLTSSTRRRIEEVYGMNWNEKKKILISQSLAKRNQQILPTNKSSISSIPAIPSSPTRHYQEPLNLHHPQYIPLPSLPQPPPPPLSLPSGNNPDIQHDSSQSSQPNTSQQYHSNGSLSIWPLYEIRSYILKTNDDLRQEMICMQLIEFCQELFITSHVSHLLWLKPYKIISTGASTGLVETLPNTLSLDVIKKSSGFISLAKYFENLYPITNLESNLTPPVASLTSLPTSSIPSIPSISASGGDQSPSPSPPSLAHPSSSSSFSSSSASSSTSSSSPISLHQAKLNFVASLAAYSLICYVFQIKDRHNGNILLDADGHIIHIDYGFILGIAPGGAYFSIETAPFKLTEDYIELLDGLNSIYFTSFIQSFTLGYLLLQSKLSQLITMIEIFAYNESIPCFYSPYSSTYSSTSTSSSSAVSSSSSSSTTTSSSSPSSSTSAYSSYSSYSSPLSSSSSSYTSPPTKAPHIEIIIAKLKSRLHNGLNLQQSIDFCLELIISSYSHLGTINYDNFQWYTNGIQP